VKVERDFATGLPPVMLDQDLCDQVFTNLFMNACEAMGEQGGEMKVRIKRALPQPAQERRGPGTPGDENAVAVEVEDSGPGVPPEMTEQIFNPFVTTKKTGVGLGLAIVSKIVDAHGGSVKLVSFPNQGACFRVTFPVGRSSEVPSGARDPYRGDGLQGNDHRAPRADRRE